MNRDVDLQTSWDPNGQKRKEGNYKDGKVMTLVAWKINGDKCPHTNVVNGNGVVVTYFPDGMEWYRDTFKDGNFVSTKSPF